MFTTVKTFSNAAYFIGRKMKKGNKMILLCFYILIKKRMINKRGSRKICTFNKKVKKNLLINAAKKELTPALANGNLLTRQSV